MTITSLIRMKVARICSEMERAAPSAANTLFFFLVRARHFVMIMPKLQRRVNHASSRALVVLSLPIASIADDAALTFARFDDLIIDVAVFSCLIWD